MYPGNPYEPHYSGGSWCPDGSYPYDNPPIADFIAWRDGMTINIGQNYDKIPAGITTLQFYMSLLTAKIKWENELDNIYWTSHSTHDKEAMDHQNVYFCETIDYLQSRYSGISNDILALTFITNKGRADTTYWFPLYDVDIWIRYDLSPGSWIYGDTDVPYPDYQYGYYDIAGTAVHEFGHLLGLHHTQNWFLDNYLNPSNPNYFEITYPPTMLAGYVEIYSNESASEWVTGAPEHGKAQRTLADDDKWGANWLYNLGYNKVESLLASAEMDKGLKLPKMYSLSQNYPNPFNPSTTISYEIPETGLKAITELSVFNIRGQLVKTLVNGYKSAGKYIIHWDGTNSSGQRVPTGAYFYRLISGNYSETRKMILVK